MPITSVMRLEAVEKSLKKLCDELDAIRKEMLSGEDCLEILQCYMWENDLNQEEIAEKLNVSPAAVGNWLIGRNGITRKNQIKIRNLYKNHPIL